MPKADRRARLAELAELRKSGKKTFDSYEVKDVQELYEEVDEVRYKTIVRDRLDQDDFVVDDNGEGYADDGREDWDRVQVYESDSEEDLPVRGAKTNKTGELYEPSNRVEMLSDLDQQPRKSIVMRIRQSKMPQTETSVNSSREMPSRLNLNPR